MDDDRVLRLTTFPDHPIITWPDTAPAGTTITIGEKTWVARWEGPYCKCHVGNHFFWEPQQ
jgi:hypothetical protein